MNVNELKNALENNKIKMNANGHFNTKWKDRTTKKGTWELNHYDSTTADFRPTISELNLIGELK